MHVVTHPLDRAVREGTDKASLVALFMAPDTWSVERQHDAAALSLALELHLHDVLRDKLGAVYNVVSAAQTSGAPARRTALVSFECAPDQADKLRGVLLGELTTLTTKGFSDEVIAKVVEQTRRRAETERTTNGGWHRAMLLAALQHADVGQLMNPDEMVRRATRDNLIAAAKHFLDPSSRYIYIEKPKP